MKATAANFLSIIKSPKQFIIPIYQRTYSWQIAQCDQLFKDVVKIGQDITGPGHFIGSVVYFEEGIHTSSEVPKLLVIDGQQRITTVLLLITALAEFIKENEVEIDTSFTKLRNYYLLNVEEDSELQYKLILTKRDKETLNDVVKGITLQGDFSKNIAENFRNFKDKISKENVVYIYNGIQRLFAVEVALEKEKDNPQLIFESMNSTGLDLSQADLIRNYILMGQDIPIQTELYEKYWFPMEQSYGNEYASYFNSFMRDYLSVKTGYIPIISRVYEEFKNFVQGNKSPNTIIEVVKDIYRYSGFYVNIALVKEPNIELQRCFKNISKLKVDVSYPFLLQLYDDFSNNILTQEEFIEILSLIENYVFRRAICGIPTNSLNKTFVTLYKSMKKTNYVEGLKAAFQLMEGYKRFPNDMEFGREIMTKDVYNFRSRNYLLSRLENHKRKEIVNIDDYTIEHIMPQNPSLSSEWKAMLGEKWKEVQEKYLHTLGNLTLTGYNSELSDKSFKDKKSMEGGFNDSPIRLNGSVRATNVWDEAQINIRAKELAEKAKEIWFGPNLSWAELEKYSISDERETFVYTIEQYEYLKGDNRELYNSLRKRILNIDSSVKEEFKKQYIAYKSSTNFVDIVPQKARLRLSLNIEFPQIIDPNNLCKDISGLGRWGNGDVEISLSKMGELDDVMELIQQAFDVQLGNT